MVPNKQPQKLECQVLKAGQTFEVILGKFVRPHPNGFTENFYYISMVVHLSNQLSQAQPCKLLVFGE